MATPRTNKCKRWILGGIVILTAAAVLSIDIADGGSSAKPDPSQLTDVEHRDVVRSVVSTGKVKPITKVEVKAKASGIVTKIYVDINAHVHQGHLLAQLDQIEILAQIAAQKVQPVILRQRPQRLRRSPLPEAKNGQRRVAMTAGTSNGSKTGLLAGLNAGDTVIFQQ